MWLKEQMLLRTSGLLWATLTLVCSALAVSGAGVVLEFDRFNRDYENVDAVVEPIRSGPLTVRLTSTENAFSLAEHTVRLEPFAGAHRGRATARFLGAGMLEARIDFGGFPGSFESHVEFPEQEVAVTGKVEIDKTSTGYEITILELPAFVEVEMRSGLGTELVSWCSRLALFVAGEAGCDQLEKRLTHPRLPLPQAGEKVFIAGDRLTQEERDQIDLYLIDL